MGDAYDAWKDSDSENDEETEEKAVTYKPSFVLIAIDTHKSMFIEDNAGKSSFMYCIEACYKIANSLILADRSSVKGPLGIIFAENKMTKANFIDFEQSIPETIQILKELKEQSNDNLKAKYERREDFDLGDFFLFCKNKFLSVKSDAYKRNVIYLTNNDDPIGNDPKMKFKIKHEVLKFSNLLISLYVFSYKNDFDNSLFYGKVLDECNSAPVEIFTDKSKVIDTLSSFVTHKYKKYRHKFYPFHGNAELYIDVVENKFIKTTSISKNMYVTRDSKKEVKKSTSRQNFVQNYELQYSKSIDKKLLLNHLENSLIQETNVPIGYTLVCVGEETSRDGWIIDPPVFIEKHFQETELLFDSFWQFCKEKLKCLICLRKFKIGGDVRIVEMVPRFVNGSRMFLVRILPFCLDVSYLPPVESETNFSTKAVDAMTDLINTLTISYKPSCFKDPVEEKKEAYIRSQLLQQSSAQEIHNSFISDQDITNKIAPHLEKLKKLNLLHDTSSVKPKRQGKQAGGSRKKVKT